MIWGTLLLAAAATGCHPVESEKITGGDLAAISDIFAAVPATAVVAHAPAPGRTRVMRPEELQRLLGASETTATFPLVCFEWKTEPLSREDVSAAMQKALQNDQAELEILETSHDPVPKGEVSFPIAGLPTAGSSGAVMWRGYVRYGTSRRFDIWARVKVSVPYTRVVAAAPIKAGELIQANQIRSEEGKGMPSAAAYLSRAEEAVGHIARRSFSEGTALTKASIGPSRDIAKGDTVQVEVRNGAARLVLEARAESAGAIGESIAVKNPTSGKIFRARIESSGRVIVDSGNGKME